MIPPIKNRIRLYRKANGLNQQEVADHLGIDRTYLSKLENQRHCPGPELMVKVCRLFNTSLGDMFYLE